VLLGRMILASFIFYLLQSSDIAFWANMQKSPYGLLSTPSQQELVDVLLNPQAELEDKFLAVHAIAFLGYLVDKEDLRSIKRYLRDDSLLVSYIKCLGPRGEPVKKELIKYHKNRLPAVRAEAVYALTRWFEDGEDFGLSQLANRALHPWQRVAALRGLADRGSSLAMVQALRRLSVEEGTLLWECLSILRRDLNQDAIPYLIELLKKERSRATNESVAMLQALTGYRIGNDYKAWKVAFLRHQAEGSVMKAPLDDSRELKTVSYLGIPILSDNICFILDSSVSMNERMYEMRRETRASKLISEWESILPRIPSFAKFNVIFFQSTVLKMYDQLALASSEVKEYARVFVKNNKFTGGTNLYGGVILGLQQEGVEELVVLSDGEPNGEINIPYDILLKIEQYNRWRNIRISTISFSAPRTAEVLMYQIAANNLGHFRNLD
jgi:hypothetical protein